jgi:hypothetical protein
MSGLIVIAFIGLALVPETRGRFLFPDSADTAEATPADVPDALVGDPGLG